MILFLALLLAFGDVAAVNSEPNLEKRSELALVHADGQIDEARKAYQAGDEKSEQAALEELAESVDICYDSLQKSRVPPRKSRAYKRAEQKLQLLMRRLNGFRDEVSFDARQHVEAVVNKISDVHDRLIADIMSKKKSD